MVFPYGPEPHGSRRTLVANCVLRCKPENLLRDPRNGCADRLQPAFGICEHEHPEAGLPELPFVLPRERELEIVPGLFLPDRERLRGRDPLR